MIKWTVNNKEDLERIVHYYREFEIYSSPLVYLPEEYPCVLIYNTTDNPNGRPWVNWEYVYKGDFE